MKLSPKEWLTLSIVVGTVIAVIYFINETATGLINAEQSVGTGVEVGAAAVGVGTGTGILIWAGQNLWPLLFGV
jgi:hypothetical protein